MFSDLGITKLVVTAIQAWIKHAHAIGTEAAKYMRKLSLRMQNITRMLPGHPEVYGLFLEEGPVLQGPHFRYSVCNPLIGFGALLYVFKFSPYNRAVERVLDIVVADQEPTIVRLVSALLEVIRLAKLTKFPPSFAAMFQVAVRQFHDALDPFAGIGVSLNLPKLHRIKDIPTVVQLYGGAYYVSTNMYERAHKTLKAVLPRSVSGTMFLSFFRKPFFFIYSLVFLLLPGQTGWM